MTTTLTFAETETEGGRKAKVRALEAEVVKTKARASGDSYVARAADEMVGKGPNPHLDGPSTTTTTTTLYTARSTDGVIFYLLCGDGRRLAEED
jgi:hypothetical protein